MMGKTMRKPLSSIIGGDDADDGDDMAMEPASEEQAAAGSALARAIKSGDAGAVYSAVCGILDMHMGKEY